MRYRTRLLVAILILILTGCSVAGGDGNQPELEQSAPPRPGITTENAAQIVERDQLLGEFEWINKLAFSPTGQILAAAEEVGSVNLIRLDTGEVATTLPGYQGISFSTDGETLATAGFGQITIWNLESGDVKQEINDITDWINDIAIAAAQPNILVAGSGLNNPNMNGIWLFDIVTGDRLGRLVRDVSTASVAITADADTVVAGGLNGTIFLWDRASESVTQEFEAHSGAVTDIALSPDGALFASSSLDGTARIWNLATGNPVAGLEGHSERVESVSWNSDSTVVATASHDATVRLWNAATGEQIHIITLESESSLSRLRATSAVFSPDGSMLAIGDSNGAVHLFILPES